VILVKCLNLYVIKLITVLSLTLFSFSTSVFSQETARSLIEKSSEAITKGDFEESSRILKDVLAKFPKDSSAPNARYLLGISQYSLGKYDEAVKQLANSKDFIADTIPIAQFHLGASHFFLGQPDKALPPLELAAKSTNQEIIPYALLYIARCHQDLGSKLLATDKTKANTAFETGLAKIKELVTKFPDNENVIDAYVTRANLNVSAGRFDAAASAIEELKNRPGAAEMGEDADYLLGYIYSQQAQVLLSEFKNEEASQAIEKARETYRRLQKSDNLNVANDAAQQLANLAFADKAYEQALSAYRELRSKDEILFSQKNRIAALRTKLTQSDGNKERLNALQRQLQREEGKLKTISTGPDTALDALIRVGDCYRELRRYDEARTVYRHALKFADAERAKDLNLEIIISLALQGQGGKADASFAEFKTKHPNDPRAEGVPFFIARALNQQGKFTEASAKLQEITTKNPNSRYAALSVQELARSYLSQKKPEEALKLIENFAAQVKSGKFKLPPDVLEDAERFRGYTLFQLGKKEEAVAVMKTLAATAKNEAIKLEATYEVGRMLNNLGKNEETIAAMQSFITAYPDAPNAGRALITIASTQEKLKKPDEAVKIYRSIVDKNEDANLKLFALEKIWRLHLAAERYEEMVKVQTELETAFPNSPRTLVGLAERIRFLEKNKRNEEAATLSQQYSDRYAKLSQAEKDSEFGKSLATYVVRNLLRKADTDFKAASKMGAPAGMDETKKAAWKKLLDSANATVDQTIKEFPETENLGSLLKIKNDVMLVQIRQKILEPDVAFTYLSQLAGTYAQESQEKIKSQVLIARASLAYQLGQKSVAARFYKDTLSQISNPQTIPWQEYERYGSILLEDKQWEDALIQFQKLRENFTKPDQAQANAVYGLGTAYLGKGDLANAQKMFSELKEKHPKSDKISEVEFSQALLNLSTGKYDEGFATLKKIMNSSAASNLTRARSLLEFGKTLELMGDKGIKTKETAQGEGNPDVDIFDLAAGYYLKLPLLYPSQPELCAESLYRLAAIKLKQSKTAKDAETKQKLMKEYESAVTKLSTDYATSEWAEKIPTLK
jgi:tetratricopeptide (TPR) repeat protein